MNSRIKQRGSVLIVAMILLLVMSMIGMAGIEVTGLEEKMVFNMRDRQSAFEAAEATLLQAEQYLDDIDVQPNFGDGTGGFYDVSAGGECNDGDEEADTESIIWKKDWAKGCYKKGNQFGQLSQAPRYIIEKLFDEVKDDSLESGKPKDQFVYYRITVLARGITASSKIRLQTVYKIKQ